MFCSVDRSSHICETTVGEMFEEKIEASWTGNVLREFVSLEKKKKSVNFAFLSLSRGKESKAKKTHRRDGEIERSAQKKCGLTRQMLLLYGFEGV